MIAPTLDIDGILDKRPYKPEPFTEEELNDLKSQATITISNQTGVTWDQNKWVTEQLGSLNLTKSPITIDNSGVAKLYLFTGKQACEVALEILAKTGFKTSENEKCYKQNIITVDTGERVNLNYISATKKHEIMTKQIELLWCEIENTKTAFLLYPEEIPEYLIAPLLSHFKLAADQLTVLSNYPPVIDTHSLTLFGSDINVDEADLINEASLHSFNHSKTTDIQKITSCTSKNNLPSAHELFKPVELVTCLVEKLSKEEETEIEEKTENKKKELAFTGYAVSEEAMGILSLAGVEQFLKLEFANLKISEILASLKRKFSEQQMRIYT